MLARALKEPVILKTAWDMDIGLTNDDVNARGNMENAFDSQSPHPTHKQLPKLTLEKGCEEEASTSTSPSKKNRRVHRKKPQLTLVPECKSTTEKTSKEVPLVDSTCASNMEQTSREVPLVSPTIESPIPLKPRKRRNGSSKRKRSRLQTTSRWIPKKLLQAQKYYEGNSWIWVPK